MTQIIFILVAVILSLYALLLLIPAFVFTFWKDRRRKLFIPKTFISVIVPVRNEEPVIFDCLESFHGLDYPKGLFEIIIVNDHSTDRTKNIVEEFLLRNNEMKITVLENESHGKKSALTVGVLAAQAQLIVTTDGDCIVPKNWLLEMAEVYENENPVFIAGPVAYKNGGGIFRDLLQIEQLVLQTISGGAMRMGFPLMCSGANMAYTKEFFLKSGGYENDPFASGDDMMLLLKANRMFPGKLKFMGTGNSIVKTDAAKKWGEAIQQRSRWISKFSGYKSFPISITGIIVLLMNTVFLISGLAIFFENHLLDSFFLALGGKMIVDLLLLSLAVRFFREPRLLLLAPFAELFYPFLAISAVMARLKGGYSWKSRRWS